MSYADDDIDEITFTHSNHNLNMTTNSLSNNRKSITGTSITSISEDRQSISTLNQQNLDNDEIIQDENDQLFFQSDLLNYQSD